MTDKTLAEMAAEMQADDEHDEAFVVRLLLPYRDAQDAQNYYGKEAGALGQQIKQWLALHPDTELVDGEHNLRAVLKTRKLPGHRYDVVAIIENNPGLWDRLVSCRALAIDHEVAKAHGLEGELKRYALPTGETAALIVERR